MTSNAQLLRVKLLIAQIIELNIIAPSDSSLAFFVIVDVERTRRSFGRVLGASTKDAGSPLGWFINGISTVFCDG